MTLEAGKEMDRKCVLDWLNKVYIAPSLSYSEYTDEEIRILAHDALVLLKEPDPVEPKKEDDGKPEPWTVWWYVCGDCGQPIDKMDRYCRRCGKQVKWDA